MTGAGSGTLIFGLEDSFMGSITGAPDLFAFGRNPTLSELSLDNQLQRLQEGDEVWSQESVKQNFEGAIGVEAVISSDVHSQVESVVFNDGGTAMTNGLAQSARVFVDVQYPTGNAKEEYLGCVPLEYSINYEQGGMVTYSLTLAYADQKPDPTTDLSTATRVSDDSSVPFHGFQLDIDGTTVSDLQSASLSISDISRLQYGASPTANRGIIANPQATLDANATFVEPTRLDLARGADASAPPDTLDSVTGTITISDEAGTVSTYSLSKLKPDTHNWNEVMSTDDTNDATTFNVDGGVTVA